jgi:hypothetical protein
MAKRHTLSYDSAELTQSLQRSAGQGVDALFAPPSPAPPERTKKSRPAQPSRPAPRRSQTPPKRARQVQEAGGYLPEQNTAKTEPPGPEPKNTLGSGHHATTAATTPPQAQATPAASRVETLRKTVKQIGKEAATHRFTIEEKRSLAELVYTYGRQGYRTTENEITRIAVNWLMLDHQENGKASVLAQVLRALKA